MAKTSHDSEGFISILEGAIQTNEPPSLATVPDFDLVDAAEEPSGDSWKDDTVPTKLEKIRAVFLNSKTAAEVRAAAGNMPVGMWLECVIKLMPKDIKVQGEVGFRHMLEGLGPINKDAYRLTATRNAPQIIQDAEYRVLVEGE